MTKTILKTIKLYLKPNKTTTKRLNEILFGCNFLYNKFLKEMIKRDKEKTNQPNLSEWSKTLTELRKENNWKVVIETKQDYSMPKNEKKWIINKEIHSLRWQMSSNDTMVLLGKI